MSFALRRRLAWATLAQLPANQNQALTNRAAVHLRMSSESVHRHADTSGRTRVRTAKLQPVFVAAFSAADPEERCPEGLQLAPAVADAFALLGPMVSIREGFYADRTHRRFGNGLQQLIGPRYRTHQRCLARLIHAMQRENVLGEIDPKKHHGHGQRPSLTLSPRLSWRS